MVDTPEAPLNCPLHVALTQVRLGAALVQAGRADEALDPLREALKALVALGASPSAHGAVCTLAAAHAAQGRKALASALLERWRLRLKDYGREPWPEEQVLVDAELTDLPAVSDAELGDEDVRVLREVDAMLAALDEPVRRAGS